MAASECTPGIVVGRTEYRDADYVVRLLTPDHGRLAALARNARKSSRRFGRALDLGNRVEAMVRPGRGELWTLESAELVDGRLGARRDLARIALLAYTCEIAWRLARADHPEPRLFGLLDMAGVLLDGAAEPPGTLFRLGFEVKALAFSGLMPVLTQCVECGEAMDGPGVWVTGRGGVAHPHCLAGPSVVFGPEWGRAIERALRTPLRALLDQAAPSGPEWVLSDELQAHIGAELRSRALLSSVYKPSTSTAVEK